jgi:hypothetical protein
MVSFDGFKDFLKKSFNHELDNDRLSLKVVSFVFPQIYLSRSRVPTDLVESILNFPFLQWPELKWVHPHFFNPFCCEKPTRQLGVQPENWEFSQQKCSDSSPKTSKNQGKKSPQAMRRSCPLPLLSLQMDGRPPQTAAEQLEVFTGPWEITGRCAPPQKNRNSSPGSTGYD